MKHEYDTLQNDTEFAIDIMKKTFGTDQYVFVDQILRAHIAVDSEQHVTFWGLTDKEKEYLQWLAGV